MNTKTIIELRKQFEDKFLGHKFPLDRNSNGEYNDILTFQAWGAYKSCAYNNGIFTGDINSEECK